MLDSTNESVQDLTIHHIGELRLQRFRAPLVELSEHGDDRSDLRRTLAFLGFEVEQVMNLTDVEDKILRRMADDGKSLQEVTEPYIQAFFEDLDVLRIELMQADLEVANLRERAERDVAALIG